MYHRVPQLRVVEEESDLLVAIELFNVILKLSSFHFISCFYRVEQSVESFPAHVRASLSRGVRAHAFFQVVGDACVE